MGRDAFYASRAQRQSPADGRCPICVSVPDGTAAESCPGAAGIRRHRSLRPAAERPAGTARKESTGYQELKSLIVKTARLVKRQMEQLSARLEGEYVAVSDFGTYVERLSAYLEANPEALTQYYSFCSDLQANTDAVSAAFGQYKTETEGYIRTGIVGYNGSIPIYGVAVGQGLTVTDVDGETVVDQNNFRATFTAQRLSFWQDANEVAYVSNNRLYITNITVLEGVTLGQWQITTASGLAFRWIGG